MAEIIDGKRKQHEEYFLQCPRGLVKKTLNIKLLGSLQMGPGMKISTMYFHSVRSDFLSTETTSSEEKL